MSQSSYVLDLVFWAGVITGLCISIGVVILGYWYGSRLKPKEVPRGSTDYPAHGTVELPACAAIQGPHGITFAGHRHHDCLAQIKAAGFGGLWRCASTQGFMTTRGRFVNRTDALDLMLAAGIESARGRYQSHLYSEDMY